MFAGLALRSRREREFPREIDAPSRRTIQIGLTFELATFSVREGEEASLVAERPRMIAALGRAFPGLLGAWLTKRGDGLWVDIILWQSREEAEDAAEHVNDVPAATNWFEHIAESHGLQHLEVAHEELFELTRR